MPPPSETALLTWVVQGGSFALLALIVVYVGRTVIPSAMAAYEKLVDKFDASLDRRDETLRTVTATLGTKIDGLGSKLDNLAESVDHLRADLDSHIDGERPAARADRPHYHTG